MVKPAHTNVLFLCTGNSCRSIFAEAILNARAGGRFRAFSAGSRPAGSIHPLALELLERRGHPVAELRSKSWEEFATPQAPVMDLVITVCDRARGEACPIWPGSPATLHWSFPDPAAFQGSRPQAQAFFAQVYGEIERAITALIEGRAAEDRSPT